MKKIITNKPILLTTLIITVALLWIGSYCFDLEAVSGSEKLNIVQVSDNTFSTLRSTESGAIITEKLRLIISIQTILKVPMIFTLKLKVS